MGKIPLSGKLQEVTHVVLVRHPELARHAQHGVLLGVRSLTGAATALQQQILNIRSAPGLK